MDTEFSVKMRFSGRYRSPWPARCVDRTLCLTGLRISLLRRVHSYCRLKLFQSWGIVVSRFLLISIIPTVFAAGCQNQLTGSIIRIHQGGDPNNIIELQGKAAEDYSTRLTEAQAANQQTAKGRQNEMLAELKKVLPWLVIIGCAGLAFWGFTRSRYGWVIPTAAGGGIVFIVALGRWAEWITAAVIIIALALLVWKCIEYQKERNAAIINTKTNPVVG